MVSTELTTAQLRVLAHPTRLALLRWLRTHGPATARALGREFTMDSGAASYHLRRLAQGGLITEDVDRGTRRERWWQAVDLVSQFEPAQHSDDELSREYVQAVVLSKADEMQRIASAVASVPETWLNATMFSDHQLMLGPGEMDELKRDLLAVVERYHQRATSDPAGADPVVVHLQLYRQP